MGIMSTRICIAFIELDTLKKRYSDNKPAELIKAEKLYTELEAQLQKAKIIDRFKLEELETLLDQLDPAES